MGGYSLEEATDQVKAIAKKKKAKASTAKAVEPAAMKLSQRKPRSKEKPKVSEKKKSGTKPKTMSVMETSASEAELDTSPHASAAPPCTHLNLLIPCVIVNVNINLFSRT